MLNSAPKFSKVNLHTNLIVRDMNAKPAAAHSRSGYWGGMGILERAPKILPQSGWSAARTCSYWPDPPPMCGVNRAKKGNSLQR